jgi:flagellar hook assembly protein FlgD
MPGNRLHLDPDQEEGFLRAVTGDLEFTSSQWLGNIDPSDTEPPVITELSATQAANTRPAGENALPVFTPNGDKLSDTITFRHTVSEGAFLKVEVKREDGTVVRKFTAWSPAGPGTSSWDGKNENGKKVPDGRYDVVVTPKDQAGNVGDPVTTAVKSLTAIKAPTASPTLFDPTDGDSLAQTTRLGVTLAKEATITWRILDKSGEVVRRGIVDQLLAVGASSWDWDGLDDAGQPLPHGVYTGLVTASTAAGTYSHTVTVRLMPFNLKYDKTVSVGQSQKLTILTAEPVDGWPVITVKQPGVAAYRLYPTRYSTTKFTATWKVKSGATGKATITITSKDSAGGSQTKSYTATIS